MGVLYIALSAFSGGIASAVMGWLDSGEFFEGRKFMASVIRALVAGGVFALGYQLSGNVNIVNIIAAFVGGAGVDALGNRLSGAIKGN